MEGRGQATSPARRASIFAEGLRARGEDDLARQALDLAEHVECWERDLVGRVSAVLATHHDMNNALTGVFGNAQLVLLGPAAEVPGVRQRLETLLREAERLRLATAQLRELRHELRRVDPPADRAAGTSQETT